MDIFFIVIGIASVVYGGLRIFGFIKTSPSQDSEMDKKIFSEENRYFIGRYWSGFGLISAGLGAIALGVILYISK
jgi:hypothetical protein